MITDTVQRMNTHLAPEVKQKGKQYLMISLLIRSPDCLNMADSQMSLKYSGEPFKYTVMQNRHLTLFVLSPRRLM